MELNAEFCIKKMKTLSWVPADVRPFTKQSNHNRPIVWNTPQSTDPPDGYERYPREAAMQPKGSDKPNMGSTYHLSGVS